jgi:predicted AAA+ superfamily ATPase
VTAFLDTPEILLLIGARQVGKTSILYLIIEELSKRTINYIFTTNLSDE